MPIGGFSELIEYVQADLEAKGANASVVVRDPISRWLFGLRVAEYSRNCWRSVPGHAAAKVIGYLVKRSGVRLGFTIPENAFGPGLSIAHWGTIVVNRGAEIGPRCRLHVGVNIGIHHGGAPRIGSDCYLGPGAKLFGPIELGDGVKVGANAVVNQSFADGAVLVGIPARDVASAPVGSHRDDRGEIAVDVVRTPDDRFAGLEGWSYEPRYVEVGDGLRMHYVDEGPADGPTVLLAHGEPTWGYLYRKMIPGLVAAGRRVVVPDLIGFGRSDKPAARDDYTYERHVAWFGALLDALDLREITLFGQDWGGLIGLVHVGRRPDRFTAVVAANTALPSPDLVAAAGTEAIAETAGAFLRWFEWSQERPELLASEVVGGADSPLNQTGHRLTPGEAAAYDTPFPDESYRAGARQFPVLVPFDDADPPASMLREAWAGLAGYDRPFVTAFADHEDVTRAFEPIFQAQVPGAADRTHVTVPNAGHFLQEHQPDLLVDVILGLG